MANHTINVSLNGTADTTIVDPVTSTGSRTEIALNDTVTFVYFVGAAGVSPHGITWTNFSTNHWTSSLDGSTPAVGNSFVKTVKAAATLGDGQITIDPADTSLPNTTWYFTVVSDIDTTPDSFSLGADLTEVALSQDYVAVPVVVSGINSATAISRTGNGEFKINSAAWRTASDTVVDGDVVQFKITASASYNTAVSGTLNIGGVTDTWQITTRVTAPVTELIPLGITSGSLKLTDIQDFFQGPTNRFNDHYHKDGTYVPNLIPENNAIPLSGNLNVRDFLGCYTSFFIATDPQIKVVVEDTSGLGAPTAYNNQWDVGTDWTLGYGPSMANNTEFKYSVTVNAHSGGDVSDVIISSGTTHTTWSSLNTWIQVGVLAAVNSEAHYSGVITFYVRHKDVPAVVITTTASYLFFFYGP